MKNVFSFLILWVILLSCSERITHPDQLISLSSTSETIRGRAEYLNSPFVTAGDRLYMVGHQDGSFPDLGWHVEGEMGGIWDHPIKLMDGFTASFETGGSTYCLNKADSFINYPFANLHLFKNLPLGLEVSRFQYVPDGQEAVVVEYAFINTSGKSQSFNFHFNGYTDLRPVWLGEQSGMNDAPDTVYWHEEETVWIGKDQANAWYVVFAADRKANEYKKGTGNCDYQPKGLGVAAGLGYALEVAANDTLFLPFTIAGSYLSEEQALETYRLVQQQAGQLLKNKIARYESIAEKTSLEVPDKELERAFRWVKYNTDWLIRDVPGIGRGLSAGLPDYPWWFGVDNEYSLQGAIMIGQKDLVYSTIELIHQLSESTNGNGRIIHEASTNGVVFNPGNINETPQFASLIWKIYQWTGDKAFLEKYYPTVKKGLSWLMDENDKDGNLLPDGFGMMEIHGLNSEMIDVAAYSQKAFADAAEMADQLGEEEQAQAYRQTAAALRTKINTEFWVPDFNSYADFIGSREQALHLLEEAIIRADSLDKPSAVKELQATRQQISALPPGTRQGFVLYHNWVVNTPMEVGLADTAKALPALETGRRFVNPFGMFVTGIDRDETAGEDRSSFAKVKKTFSYTGAVMTLPTGVQAIAENNYGRPDQALDYLQRMTRSFSYALPGSIYEVSPDYGMMAQAWNLYSYAVPIVEQFFGIRPRAYEKVVRLQPQFPSSWPQAKLKNVQIGENALDISFEKKGEGMELSISQTKQDWTVEMAFPRGKYERWELNGSPVQPKQKGAFDVLEVKGEKQQLQLY